MRVIVKDTVCVFCASRLVLDGEIITCEENCEISQDLHWHPETWSKLKPVIDYQTSVEDRQQSCMKFNGYPFWSPLSGLAGGCVMGAIISLVMVGIFLLAH